MASRIERVDDIRFVAEPHGDVDEESIVTLQLEPRPSEALRALVCLDLAMVNSRADVQMLVNHGLDRDPSRHGHLLRLSNPVIR